MFYTRRKRLPEGSDAYSIILTKGFIMHRMWLEAYTTDVPEEMQAFIREHKNCEDLTMQYLVSNRTGLAPLRVHAGGCVL